MYLFVLILLVAAAIGTAASYACIRSYRRAWHDHVAWAEQILASDDDEWKAELEYPREPQGTWGRLRSPSIVGRARIERHDARLRMEANRARTASLEQLEWARQPQELASQFVRYKNLWLNLDAENMPAAVAERREVTLRYVQHLLEQARSGHIQSFVNLTDIVTRTRGRYYSTYRRMTGEEYDRPDDWNDLVAMTYRKPPVRLYGRHPEPIQELGRKARDDQSLTWAKYVLAHYDQYDADRQTIGIALATELANFVSKVHDEQEMSFVDDKPFVEQ